MRRKSWRCVHAVCVSRGFERSTRAGSVDKRTGTQHAGLSCASQQQQGAHVIPPEFSVVEKTGLVS